jgi:hypothetical protein
MAANQLNALAMFEMLPALAGLGAGRPGAVEKILASLNGRGLTGCAERIKWAGEVVAGKRLPSWQPAGFPPDQIQDAQRFLSAPSGSAGSGSASADVMAAVRRGLITGGGAAQLLEFEKNGVITGSGGGTAIISPGCNYWIRLIQLPAFCRKGVDLRTPRGIPRRRSNRR